MKCHSMINVSSYKLTIVMEIIVIMNTKLGHSNLVIPGHTVAEKRFEYLRDINIGVMTPISLSKASDKCGDFPSSTYVKVPQVGGNLHVCCLSLLHEMCIFRCDNVRKICNLLNNFVFNN